MLERSLITGQKYANFEHEQKNFSGRKNMKNRPNSGFFIHPVISNLYVFLGNVLFVGHGGTLFSCTTQLCGLPIPSEQEAYHQFINTQYLDCKEAQELTDGVYMLNDSPILPFTCSGHRKNETL